MNLCFQSQILEDCLKLKHLIYFMKTQFVVTHLYKKGNKL
jgi:hypothetical protein